MVNEYGRNRQGKGLLIVVLVIVVCMFIGSLVQFLVTIGEVLGGPSYVESKAVLEMLRFPILERIIWIMQKVDILTI